MFRCLFVALFFTFNPAILKAEESLPVLYNSDWEWMKSSMSKVQKALEKAGENASLEKLAQNLEPVIINEFLPFVIQKSMMLDKIEEKISTSNNSNQKAELSLHKTYHEKQINYLCEQLKVRYGFAKLWNKGKSNRENLNKLNSLFAFKTSGSKLVATLEKPGTNSASFKLMLPALKERIDTRYAEYSADERTEAFRLATLSRCSRLKYARVLVDLEEDFDISRY